MWRRLKRSEKVAAILIACIPLLGALIAPVEPLLLAHEDSPDIRLADMAVTDGGVNKPAVVDLKLENKGRARVLLTRARLQVVQVFDLAHCAGQGGLAPSSFYDVRLGDHPETITVPISQTIAGGDDDRFELLLGIPSNLGLANGTTFVYQLHLTLGQAKGQAMADAGDVVVGLPGTPSSPDNWSPQHDLEKWSNTVREVEGEAEVAKAVGCWSANKSILGRIARIPAWRSLEMNTLMDEVDHEVSS